VRAVHKTHISDSLLIENSYCENFAIEALDLFHVTRLYW